MADAMHIKRIVDALGQNNPVDFVETSTGFSIDGEDYSLGDMRLLFGAAGDALRTRYESIESITGPAFSKLQEGVEILTILGESLAAGIVSSGIHELKALIHELETD